MRHLESRTKHLISELKLTLQTHDQLNPKLWKDEKLLPDVWLHLNRIGKAWSAFAKIPHVAIVDVIVIGGNANYNYTDQSDIDLHIIVDKSKIKCEGLLDDFLQSKKELWAKTHNITIKGHPVELYAQDKNDSFKQGQGVYSINSHKWLQKPTKVRIDRNDTTVKAKVKAITKEIDSLIASKSDDIESFNKLKNRIRAMRASGIQKGGEMSLENLAFKELRNRGVLDRMNKYILDIHDKSLSL
ncbi:hypothetical protein SCRM01_125c [Synechococcus phage S-CRM01]|uniref:hypothetical protein n=1 Tax=Synechococcus phage S-CRM01 TaxID=1026955 RepID=UPI000209E3B9|nr:hypothetical protein SCRM01_125c [Synechococcus phage S-CRM01]AEC53071.1 hypothetical protein SCRM01_125c [Synechococcus phage S-CRM01]